MNVNCMDWFVVHKMGLLVFVLWTTFGGGWSLEEPFDLEFGPDVGDKFQDKADGCTSDLMGLEGPLRYDNYTIVGVKACPNVYIDLVDDAGDTHNIEIADIDGDTEDTILDRMCMPSVDDDDNICEWYLQYDSTSDAYEADFSDYVTGKHAIIFTYEKAHEWDYISFLRKNVDIYFDDQWTTVLGGADTKYVNLVDNIFVRNISSQHDLDIINSRIGQDFSADYGAVMTFYKVKDYSFLLNYQISAQVVIACDQAQNTTNQTVHVTDNKCYMMTQYRDVNYMVEDGSSAEASFALDSGNVQLPFDGTKKAQKWETTSNVGVPGLWIFEFNQGYEAPFVLIPPHLVSFCHGAYFMPSSLPLYSGGDNSVDEVVIQCTGFFHNSDFTLDVKLIGSSFNKTIQASFDYSRTIVIIPVPVFWGANEVVQVSMDVDNVERKIDATLSFHDELVDGLLQIEYLSATRVNVSWPNANINESTTLVINQFSYNGSQIGYESLDDADESLEAGNTSIIYEFDTDVALVRFELDSYQGKFVSIVSIKEETNCVDWIHDQLDRDLTECAAEVEMLHGCPTNDPASNGAASDSYWAHEEVENGPNDWFYDPCCNQQANLPSSPNGVCNARNCEYNLGADFCIRSPSVPCYDKHFDQTLYVSNQCCYNEQGNLLDSQAVNGTGRMSVSKASFGNLHRFFKTELEAYEKCCEDDFRCELFHQNRPALVGSYKGSLTIPVTFGGQFETGDGVGYTFLGLGVYTFLQTDLDIPTTMQITTRADGAQAVVAGFAISYGHHKIEVMRPYTVPANKTERLRNYYFVNDFMVFTDLMIIDAEDPFDLYFGGINIKKETGGRSVQVTVPNVNLCVNIFMARNYFNLYVTVPESFIGHTQGLVGLLDGNPGNDFKPNYRWKDALVQPVEPTTLHDEFAESWKVENPKDWLFGEFLSGMISAEINSGPVMYNYSIPSEQTDAYDQLCHGNLACELGVVRSGNQNFAADFQDLAQNHIRGPNSSDISMRFRASIKSGATVPKNTFHSVMVVVMMLIGPFFITI